MLQAREQRLQRHVTTVFGYPNAEAPSDLACLLQQAKQAVGDRDLTASFACLPNTVYVWFCAIVYTCIVITA